MSPDVFARAWSIAYAITYGHDSRPLDLAWAGCNRFELDRDGPEISRMARYVAAMDKAVADVDAEGLAPWDAARKIARVEAEALGYSKHATWRMMLDLTLMEHAQKDAKFIQIGPVTHGTIEECMLIRLTPKAPIASVRPDPTNMSDRRTKKCATR